MRPSIEFPNDKKGSVMDRRGLMADTLNVDNMEEGEQYDDSEEEISEDKKGNNEKGELVSVPKTYCSAAIEHYIHEDCLKHMQQNENCCPRCRDIEKRTNFESQNVTLRRYCEHVTTPMGGRGFTGSSKINAIVDYYKSVPKSDKVMILSFFKGGLDLLEGIFMDDMGVDCARFDGDLSKHHSIAELKRFQTDPNCKILLATVQSGGVGLNIVQANHVLFLDRWYNPFVHEQAEDRVYRIGQEKEVFITYFDCAATIDEVSQSNAIVYSTQASGTFVSQYLSSGNAACKSRKAGKCESSSSRWL
jgi:SNF2 family DNA or RNA helicase